MDEYVILLEIQYYTELRNVYLILKTTPSIILNTSNDSFNIGCNIGLPEVYFKTEKDVVLKNLNQNSIIIREA